MKRTSGPGSGLLRLIRALHAGLGIFIFPWIAIIGASGFYLDQPRTILLALTGPDYAESRIDAWRDLKLVTEASARAVARGVWSGEPIGAVAEVVYHDRSAIEVTKPSGRIIVTRPTGHYFVDTGYTRRIHAPDGTLLGARIEWGAILGRLHVRRWLDSGLGSALASLASLAMLVFGLSGMVLWAMPRSRRLMRLLSRAG